MEKDSKIYIAGHIGLVGSAVMRRLIKEGYRNLVYRSHKELDLRRQELVERFFEVEHPDYVFLVASKVGGITANNTYRAEFIYDNLMIEANVIHSAYQQGVQKLLFLGSSCIYPKFAPQPMKEEHLLVDKLEETNEPYAISKIAGIKLCESYNRQYGTNFISAMPTNLYGINDNFNLETSHVLPALIRRFHEAKRSGCPKVVLWGTGSPFREFLFVDDAVEALLFLMNCYNDNQFVNLGTGKEISIKDLAYLIKEIVGYPGAIEFDSTKPDGTPRKLLDVSKINALGWTAKTALAEGIENTYQWFVENYDKVRGK